MVLETNKPVVFEKQSCPVLCPAAAAAAAEKNRRVYDDVARPYARFTRTSKRVFRIAPYENTRGFEPFFSGNGHTIFETVRKVTTEYSVGVLVSPILLQ
jgi:hypothetical protein